MHYRNVKQENIVWQRCLDSALLLMPISIIATKQLQRNMKVFMLMRSAKLAHANVEEHGLFPIPKCLQETNKHQNIRFGSPPNCLL